MNFLFFFFNIVFYLRIKTVNESLFLAYIFYPVPLSEQKYRMYRYGNIWYMNP
jgi:hypothetical protein